MYGHENGLLSNDMFAFGIEILKLENETANEDLIEVLFTFRYKYFLDKTTCNIAWCVLFGLFFL